jgi:serine/threonine protein kinase
MTLSPNQINFISVIKQLDKIDDRFSVIECVNTQNGKKINGNFSLIFKGHDSLENVPVAIKFFDPDKTNDKYRLEAFNRESDLLTQVMTKKRCLNIIQKCKDFKWKIPTGESHVEVPIPFFITEWLDEGIEHYCFEQETIECLSKLNVFRDILLAIQSMHDCGISHRDIKLDNLRKKTVDNNQDCVVAIDYGTSVHLTTSNLVNFYCSQVGHGGYSSPEALSGLAGDRELSFKTDIYALGCIIYELFNVDAFFTVLRKNTHFNSMITVSQFEMTTHANSDTQTKRKAWLNAISPWKNAVLPFTILDVGNTVPKAIDDNLDKLFKSLIQWNFTKRLCNFSKILRQVDVCIRILENENRQIKIIETKRTLRNARLEKIKFREQRAIEYKNQKGLV